MCSPFIKWVGGKRQLIGEILPRLPKSFNQYHEPFLGGGAVFFALSARFDLSRGVHLSDLNAELINTYQVVRDDLDKLSCDLKKHRNTPLYFQQVRAQDRSNRFKSKPPYKRASRFIFLNKTAFNGLYRVNGKGYCNTSYGSYPNPKIYDETALSSCSKALQGAQLYHRPFGEALDAIEKGDLVYLDPPYDPVSKTANFTAYTAEKFNSDMQQQVKDFCDAITKKGAYFILSNSHTAELVALYGKEYRIETVSARRHVNCKAEGRGAIQEIIVRNY